VVTQAPRKFSLEGNAPTPDAITQLALVQGWPPSTWTSPLQRALYQARKLHEYAGASGGKLVLIKTRADLAAYLERRGANPKMTAGWLTVEGAHALEGDLANLDKLYDAGYRMVSPSHLFDSDLGGSSTGLSRGGLSDLGKRWVRRMEEKHMIIDLAHASDPAFDDVLALAQRPIIISHTGVKGTCDNNRNVTDDQLRRVAANGGLIGIGFWQFATCGQDIAAIVRAIRHAIVVAGADHVALGSDFDGSVATPIDTAQLAWLTGALIDSGLSEAQVRRVMGGNVIRFLQNELP
jgi:membrane dipeptidase